MNVFYMYNNDNVTHYTFDDQESIKLTPRLEYSGMLSKSDGWEGHTHSHPYAEIIYVTRGSGRTIIDDNEVSFTEGDIVIYNAGSVHHEYADENSNLEMQFVALDDIKLAGLLENHLIPSDYPNVYNTGSMKKVFQRYFALIVEESSNKEKYYHEIAQNMSKTMLLYLFRLIEKNHNDGLLEKNEVLDRVVRFTDEHYLENITLDTIANECFLNKYYISHLFAKYKKVSVGQYILSKRLARAQTFLFTTELPIADIAEKSGFSDPNYFCRVFKKTTGITPLQYRQRNR